MAGIDQAKSHRIGVISDTHGLLRPEVLKALEGCEQILHAGDVGKPEILESLRKIAPVTAVRGNVDREQWAQSLPVSAVVEVGNVLIYMLHNLNDLNLNPAAAGFGVVVYGHSHRYAEETREGVLYLNPGSAGPRRFGLPLSLALLHIQGKQLSVDYVELDQG